MISGKGSKGIKSFSGYRSGTIVSENGTTPAGGKRKFNVALRIVLGVWSPEEWTGVTEDMSFLELARGSRIPFAGDPPTASRCT